MRIAFRADASIEIGTGHVMRCLTLADALTERGHQCFFICRELQGHLGSLITSKGYLVHLLPLSLPFADSALRLNTIEAQFSDTEPLPRHSTWLGVSWQQDAAQTINAIQSSLIDWLIVDHYALDFRWQNACQPYYSRLAIIDDLADRQHISDLLIDQTYSRNPSDYKTLTPKTSTLLCGTEYALLRPEFSQWREYSLNRRRTPELNHILVNLGGMDKDNITGQILTGINKSHLKSSINITVVMGQNAPHKDSIIQQAKMMKYSCKVLFGVNNMAEIMANSDLAIGAAGSTSWERCTLGLPTIMLVLAENQTKIASSLAEAGACFVSYSSQPEIIKNLVATITPKLMGHLSKASQQIADGCGVNTVLVQLESL